MKRRLMGGQANPCEVLEREAQGVPVVLGRAFVTPEPIGKEFHHVDP